MASREPKLQRIKTGHSAAFVLRPAELRIYLDEDCDGGPDDTPAECAEWESGKREQGQPKGAIVLVKSRQYGAGDTVDERSPIKIGWDNPDGARPQRWKATLEVTENEDKIRVFRDLEEGATQVLGKGRPRARYEIHNDDVLPVHLNAGQDVVIWTEAVDYPQEIDGSDECATLKFTYSDLSRGGGLAARSYVQHVQVRIAPWIMASDLDETEKLYILDFTEQPSVKNGPYRVLNTELRSQLQGITSELVQVQPVKTRSIRRYLRDVMRFGTHTATDAQCYRVVLRGNNMQTSATIPKTGIDRREDSVGYIELGKPFETDLETGGNMMVSPPMPGYPFGRIICGSIGKGGLPYWERFLYAQRVQRPLKIDTSWLSVGHSDEIVAFVPKVKGDGFKMLLASPKRAYEIICNYDWNFTKLASEKARLSGAEAEADAQWEAAVKGEASQGRSIDFRGFAKGKDIDRPVSDGHGRLSFNRYNNKLKSQHRWVQDFLLEDPLLKKLVQTMAQEPSTSLYRAKCLSTVYDSERVGSSLPSPAPAQPVSPHTASIEEKLLQYYREQGIQFESSAEIMGLLHVNLILQVKLDKIGDFLCKELSIKPDDVIPVPMLYHNAADANSIVGNMINLVQLNSPPGGDTSRSDKCTCIVPLPHGPIADGIDLFEKDFGGRLNQVGIDVEFIDEWYEYHLDGGEIHCGTNQLPKAVAKKWWELDPFPDYIRPEVLQWPEGRTKLKGTLRVTLDGEPQVDGYECTVTMGAAYANRQVDLPVEGYEDEILDPPADGIFARGLRLGHEIGLVTKDRLQTNVSIGSIKGNRYVDRFMTDKKLRFRQSGMPADDVRVAEVRLSEIQEPEDEPESEPMGEGEIPPPPSDIPDPPEL